MEGFEKQVLEGLDLERYRPWIFAIESTVPATRVPSFGKWEHLLTDKGYDVAMNDTCNRYYVDAAHAGLKDRFLDKRRLCEMYDVHIVDPFRHYSVRAGIKEMLWEMLQRIRV